MWLRYGEMETYKSPIFGEVKMPEYFERLMEFPAQLSRLEGENIMIWRGQGDITWPIHSGAYRRLEKNGAIPNEYQVIQYEESLLSMARHRGYGTNEGMPINDMELLSKLQHHGAATRLVDFSKSMLVALWFCVNSNVNKTGLLTGVHTMALGGLGYEGYLENREYEILMGNLDDDHNYFIEPPAVSKRIAAQHAVFLYSKVVNDKTGSLFLPKEKGATLYIAISPELKREVRKILIESFDIRTETLFPDLDGFASLVNNAYSKTTEMYRW